MISMKSELILFSMIIPSSSIDMVNDCCSLVIFMSFLHISLCMFLILSIFSSVFKYLKVIWSFLHWHFLHADTLIHSWAHSDMLYIQYTRKICFLPVVSSDTLHGGLCSSTDHNNQPYYNCKCDWILENRPKCYTWPIAVSWPS